MLTRRLLAAGTAVIALTATHGTAAAAPKPGGGGANCGLYTCQVEVEVPGSDGTSGGESRPGTGAGGEESGDASRWTCTYELADPQPPEGSKEWDGHKPGDGAVYEEECQFDPPSNVTMARMVWLADPPEEDAVNPAVLAREAVDKMLLRGPEIGITPKPGGKGVVGMPVYLWTARGAETYGPNTASASAGGITVTATAKVAKIEWQMGDGTTVTCTTPGTPYKAEYGKKPSPDCGHRYTKPSSTTASGDYHVTATSTWDIDWQVNGGGASGEMTEIRDSAVDITVAEVQVLN